MRRIPVGPPLPGRMPGMSLRPGEVFAGYTIERELGSGGMGAVYLAHHPRLPRFDALKLLRSELCDDPNFVGRFEREADTVAQLDHPNIVAVYDRGSTDGQLWISMRFIDGTNAEKALSDYRGGMPPERAVRIVTRVASALDYAHRHQLLHRDVKPANILLAPGPDDEEEAERVFLSDFGVAKAIGAAADRIASLTSTGSVVATLDYASPEQIKGQSLDHRSDIYALGCVLYKLLTGSVPFPGDSIASRVYGHLNTPARPPSTIVDGLPAGFDDVVARAMAKDPDDRYTTCRALARAAQAALDGTLERDPPAARPAERDPATTVTSRPNAGDAGRPSEPVPGWFAGRPTGAPTTGPQTGPSGPWTPVPPTGPTGSQPVVLPGTQRPPTTWPDTDQGVRGTGPSSTGPSTTGPHTAPPGRPPDGHAPPASDPDRRRSRRTPWIAAAVASVLVIAAVAVALTLRGTVGGTAAPSNGTPESTASSVETGALTYGPSPTPVPTTSSPPVPGLPQATPLAEQVVVLPQVVDGTADLYAVSTDGSSADVRLTSGASGPQAPVLSPDRGSVIYVQSSTISAGLRTVAVDGSGDRALWDGRPADCQSFFRPAWNPIDQTLLAVVCVTTKGTYALSVIGVDKAVTATLDTGLATVGDVSYSPDGTTLTYRGTDGFGATTSAIYTQPADGGAPPTKVTDGTAVDTGPMFSPDGSRIVFSRADPDAGGSSIMVMNADGSDPQQLTEGTAHDADPAWSPDGTQIAFLSDRSTGDVMSSQPWVMLANGQNPEPLSSYVSNGPPAWGRR